MQTEIPNSNTRSKPPVLLITFDGEFVRYIGIFPLKMTVLIMTNILLDSKKLYELI